MPLKCRFCDSLLVNEVINLGHQPPSNAYLSADKLNQPEVTFPLKVYVCSSCWLVQLPEHTSAEHLFTHDYAYFSSISSSWLEHSRIYANRVICDLSLNSESFVVEIASNDGYLLKYFVDKKIPCLGIEPTSEAAQVSLEKGIETLQVFFGSETSNDILSKYRQADLIIANNVLAHVPDINDFMKGISSLIADHGVITFEFPHLLNLLSLNQFDTIYHEHYSYLSFTFVCLLAKNHSLKVIDVEKLNTHGGSLRVWLTRSSKKDNLNPSVNRMLELEKKHKLDELNTYTEFQNKADKIKNEMLTLLLDFKKLNYRVCAYGAAAKGNTFLNFAGVKKDLIDFVVDKSPSKIGKFMPSSHLEIKSPEILQDYKPEQIIVLPWNISSEIKDQLRSFGVNSPLHTFIPSHKIL